MLHFSAHFYRNGMKLTDLFEGFSMIRSTFLFVPQSLSKVKGRSRFLEQMCNFLKLLSFAQDFDRTIDAI